jgi:hypothetical protein
VSGRKNLPISPWYQIWIDKSQRSSLTAYIDEWVCGLRRKYKGCFNVAGELCKGPIVYVLQKYDFITVNPAMLAKYREAFSPSGVKDAPTDAELALELTINYPIKVNSLKLASTSLRKLSFLVDSALSPSYLINVWLWFLSTQT